MAESQKIHHFDVNDEVLESLVGYNLKRAYMIFQSDFRATLGETGITTRAFSVLSLIAQVTDITQSEISRRLGIERSGLVAIVDDLQEKGYTVRVPVPGDRRIQALSLTKEGKKAYNEAKQAIAIHEQNLLSDFNKKEVKQLLSLLKRLRKPEDSVT